MIEVWLDRKKAAVMSILRDSPEGCVGPGDLCTEAYRRDPELWSGDTYPTHEAWFLLDRGAVGMTKDWKFCLLDHPDNPDNY